MHYLQVAMAPLRYMDRVLETLSESPDLRRTFLGITQQTSYAVGGALAGGLIGGPAGAFIGTLVGAAYGYSKADAYDDLISAVRKLSDEEKEALGSKVQQLVGSLVIDEFFEWIKSEVNHRRLFSVLEESVGKTH
uniref:Uncharacterized protein n=1 Tax=Parascaris univalens TaxID=6257 RepID=A0A915A538_PARUN